MRWEFRARNLVEFPPAIGYGRVYFTTEGGLYALGDKSKPFKVVKDKPFVLPGETVEKGAAPAVLQVVPAEVLTKPGETTRFTVKAFDAKGRPVPAPVPGVHSTAQVGVSVGAGIWTRYATTKLVPLPLTLVSWNTALGAGDIPALPDHNRARGRRLVRRRGREQVGDAGRGDIVELQAQPRRRAGRHFH